MGLKIGSVEEAVPFKFTAYDGSGPARELMDLSTLASGVLRVTGVADFPLSVVDAAGGTLEVVLDGSQVPAAATTPSVAILTFNDGAIHESQPFNVTQTATIAVTP